MEIGLKRWGQAVFLATQRTSFLLRINLKRVFKKGSAIPMDESRIGIFFLSPFQIIAHIYLHWRFHRSDHAHSSDMIQNPQSRYEDEARSRPRHAQACSFP